VQHVQGRDLKPRVVVDAENVRRSTWPNLSKEELVARARAWAAREDADLLVVFDGDPPEDVRPRSPRARRRQGGTDHRRRLFSP
jgi:hypothetical protein